MKARPSATFVRIHNIKIGDLQGCNMRNYSRKRMKHIKNKIAYNVLYDPNYNMFANLRLSERDTKAYRDHIWQIIRNHKNKQRKGKE